MEAALSLVPCNLSMALKGRKAPSSSPDPLLLGMALYWKNIKRGCTVSQHFDFQVAANPPHAVSSTPRAGVPPPREGSC